MSAWRLMGCVTLITETVHTPPFLPGRFVGRTTCLAGVTVLLNPIAVSTLVLRIKPLGGVTVLLNPIAVSTLVS
jgi:hypothetical protein